MQKKKFPYEQSIPDKVTHDEVVEVDSNENVTCRQAIDFLW